jgi:hypothetical protein
MKQNNPGFLARLFGGGAPTGRHAAPAVASGLADGFADVALFACSTCGRTDLPEAGDWDPPICVECDAAINFDAEVEAGYFDQ